MDLPCCKSFKLATLSLKRDLLATQHLIKSFANNDENIPYFTTIFVILFQTFYFLTFLWKHLAHSVYRVSAKKLPVWAVFFSTWLYGKYLVPSNQIFWGNFDYFMSKLTTFNQSAVLCLCWPLSALIFLSTNTHWTIWRNFVSVSRICQCWGLLNLKALEFHDFWPLFLIPMKFDSWSKLKRLIRLIFQKRAKFFLVTASWRNFRLKIPDFKWLWTWLHMELHGIWLVQFNSFCIRVKKTKPFEQIRRHFIRILV